MGRSGLLRRREPSAKQGCHLGGSAQGWGGGGRRGGGGGGGGGGVAAPLPEFLRSRHRIQTGILTDAPDQDGARRQVLEHGAVGEGGISAHPEWAILALLQLIQTVTKTADLACSQSANGGRCRSCPPLLPLLRRS